LHWQSKKGWVAVEHNVADEVCAIIIQDGYGGSVCIIFIVSRVFKNLLAISLDQVFPSKTLGGMVEAGIGDVEADQS
jgi:hypothetical protein